MLAILANVGLESAKTTKYVARLFLSSANCRVAFFEVLGARSEQGHDSDLCVLAHKSPCKSLVKSMHVSEVRYTHHSSLH